MAIASLYTVCVILIVMHKQAALNIERSLCLETIIKFMNDQQKCGFNGEYAEQLLKDYDDTCQTKCQVTINDIYGLFNLLAKVELRFGYEIYEYEPCRMKFLYRALNMNITCPALWNKVKVPIGGYCTQDKQCHGSKNSGVCELGKCVCKAGYVLSKLKCHEGNLTLNQFCSFSEQCSESPYASCIEGKCSCIEGYTAEDSTYCVQKNLALDQPCSFSEQCSESPYVSCLGGKCSCIEGYTAEESTYCVQIEVPVGGYCMQNKQCQGGANSVVCKNKRCVCKLGYFLFHLGCYEGNLALNQSCSLSEQCTGSSYTSCLGGKCSCIKGYTANNSTDCVQINVPVGGYCTDDEHCQHSKISIVCRNGKCVCRTGHILFNLECHKCQEITVSSSLQHHQEETKIGTTLGALFGGLLLGVILTTVAVAIIYRRSKTRVNKREEPSVAFVDNNRYSLAKIVDHGTFQNIQSKDKKRDVSPYACSEETWIYDNVYSKPRNRQTQEAVYNHLHEQDKQDDIDYYDHACAASAHIGVMGDYCHLQHTTS